MPSSVDRSAHTAAATINAITTSHNRLRGEPVFRALRSGDAIACSNTDGWAGRHYRCGLNSIGTSTLPTVGRPSSWAGRNCQRLTAETAARDRDWARRHGWTQKMWDEHGRLEPLMWLDGVTLHANRDAWREDAGLPHGAAEDWP